jgi:YVTN family beta-propeller protein
LAVALALVASSLFAAVSASPAYAATSTMAYVANSGTGTISVINTATNTVVNTIALNKGPNFAGLSDLAAAPNGSRIYVAVGQAEPFSGRLYAIDTATHAIVSTLVVPHNPAGMAINPTGTRLYVTESTGRSVAVVDTRKNKVLATVLVGDNPGGVAVTPDGAHVYVANGEFDNPYPDPYPAPGTVSVIDTATNTVTATLQTTPRATGVAISRDGTRAYVTSRNFYPCCGTEGTVTVIDTATNDILATVVVANEASGVAVSPDGRRVYATITGPPEYDGTLAGTLRVIDTATNTLDKSLDTPVGNQPLRVALTPDGTRAYVTNFNSSIDQVTVLDTTRVLPGGGFPVVASLHTEDGALPIGVLVISCRRCA